MPFSVPNFRDFGLHFGFQNWLQKVIARILAFSWRSWALLDRPWGVLGGSWGVLGPFPGDPEALLGRSEGSWGVLGASWGVFKTLCRQKPYFCRLAVVLLRFCCAFAYFR